MNKTVLFTVLAAAAMTAALSCSKEEKAPVAGKPITVEVGAPVVDVDPATSVALTSIDPAYTLAWEAGDKIHVINYQDGTAGYNDWGDFTTTEGGATASFTGTAGTNSYTKYLAARAYNGYTFSCSSTADSFKYNIPANQDGTGAKYCCFAEYASYDGATLSIPTMHLRSALTRFDLPAAADVRQVTVTVAYSESAGSSIGLCSSGDAYDVVCNFLNGKKFAGSGGPGKTITISNGGALLSGPVYFVSRHTLSDAKYGTVTLTFVFTNSSAQTCTRTVTLFNGGDAISIKTGYLNYLGAVNLKPSDFS
ncbi:MAG: hypothetical protein IJV01_05390 [Bacteroidales bacterium]|nr:hypothetical protein [Bacteroidales bacterium]